MTFNTPSIARANFDFTYLKAASAVLNESNEPILMNDCVNPCAETPISGVLIIRAGSSPNVPEAPLDFEIKTLYLSRLTVGSINLRGIYNDMRFEFDSKIANASWTLMVE